MSNRTCAECGVAFTTARRHATCSPECRRQRTARRTAAAFTTSQRMAIFDRDDWTCGICGETVDANLRHPDPMSATADHVVAIADGGQHSIANAQCAHWICNSRKGPVNGHHVALTIC